MDWYYELSLSNLHSYFMPIVAYSLRTVLGTFITINGQPTGLACLGELHLGCNHQLLVLELSNQDILSRSVKVVTGAVGLQLAVCYLGIANRHLKPNWSLKIGLLVWFVMALKANYSNSKVDSFLCGICGRCFLPKVSRRVFAYLGGLFDVDLRVFRLYNVL